MFATKGWLKTTLLIVGFLVVGFLMYEAFQVQEVEASHTKSWNCIVGGGHLPGALALGYVYVPTGNTSVGYTNCGSSCLGSPKKWHTYEEVQEHKQETWYYHHVFGGGYCHSHTYRTPTSTSPFYRLVPCGG